MGGIDGPPDGYPVCMSPVSMNLRKVLDALQARSVQDRLPYPYCHIETIREDGRAYNGHHHFLVTLEPEGIAEMLRLFPHLNQPRVFVDYCQLELRPFPRKYL